MLFIIESNKYIPAGYMRLKVKRAAKYSVYARKLSGNDIAIDNYCRKTYKQTLKDICWEIINNIKILPDIGREQYLVILEDKELDKIAHIITYGNGEFGGSKILQEALTF